MNNRYKYWIIYAKYFAILPLFAQRIGLYIYPYNHIGSIDIKGIPFLVSGGTKSYTLSFPADCLIKITVRLKDIPAINGMIFI
jgi:hypothetical protein